MADVPYLVPSVGVIPKPDVHPWQRHTIPEQVGRVVGEDHPVRSVVGLIDGHGGLGYPERDGALPLPAQSLRPTVDESFQDRSARCLDQPSPGLVAWVTYVRDGFLQPFGDSLGVLEALA